MAKNDAREADYFRQFERYIELVRCEYDVFVTIEVADYLLACGSVVLVMRTVSQHDRIHGETEIL